MGPLKENPTGYGGIHTLWAFLSHSTIQPLNIEKDDEEVFEAPLSRSLQPVSAPLDWTFDQQVMLCNPSFLFCPQTTATSSEQV